MELINTKTYMIIIYASYTGASEYIKQILMAIKGEIDSNTIKVEDFNIPTNINGQIVQTENK